MRTLSLTILLLLLVAPTPAAAADTSPWLTRLDDAVATARGSGKPIFVDLYAEWCGWCKRLDREVFSTPQFLDYSRKFVLLRVDTEDGGDGTQLASRFGVASLPSALILTAKLAKMGEVQGFARTELYITKIEHQLDRYRSLAQATAALTASSDTEVLRAVAEQLHSRLDGEGAARLYGWLLERGVRDPDEANRLRYRLADSLRLAQRFDEAEAMAGSIWRMDREIDPALAEQVDLLGVLIARDRGHCQEAIHGLETFLSAHPQSDLERSARQALKSLRSRATSQCT